MDILSEASYFSDMRGRVEPYLEARKQHLWLEREPGKRISCNCYQADQPRGTVVMCHGFTETAEKYKENIYYFLLREYHVFIWDHCGHGRSYRLTDDPSLVHVDSFSRYVSDAAFVAKRAKKEQPRLPLFLYGHSMGGGISAALLAKEPRLFQKAILSSPMIRPLTNGVPWPIAKAIVTVAVKTGHGKAYVPGQHAFDADLESFETSASACRERFDYYQEKRRREPLYQMTAPSCQWLYGAAQLNHFLRADAWQKIRTPFLLFQAEKDTLVDHQEQERFVEKVRGAKHTEAELVRIPGSRHEIFNSSSKVVQKYWETVFSFLQMSKSSNEKSEVL